MLCPKCKKEIANDTVCSYCGYDCKNTNQGFHVSHTDEHVNINNNPFSCRGRMERLSYIITIVVSLVSYCIAHTIAANINIAPNTTAVVYSFINITIMLIAFIAVVSATSKRLRDLQWSQWLLLLLFLPYVVIILEIPLLILKGKYVK